MTGPRKLLVGLGIASLLLIAGGGFYYARLKWGPPVPPTWSLPAPDRPAIASMQRFSLNGISDQTTVTTTVGATLTFEGEIAIPRDHWVELPPPKQSLQSRKAVKKHRRTMFLKPLMYKWGRTIDLCVAQGVLQREWKSDNMLFIKGSIQAPQRAGKYEFRILLDEGVPVPGKPRYALVRFHVIVE